MPATPAPPDAQRRRELPGATRRAMAEPQAKISGNVEPQRWPSPETRAVRRLYLSFRSTRATDQTGPFVLPSSGPASWMPITPGSSPTICRGPSDRSLATRRPTVYDGRRRRRRARRLDRPRGRRHHCQFRCHARAPVDGVYHGPNGRPVCKAAVAKLGGVPEYDGGRRGGRAPWCHAGGLCADTIRRVSNCAGRFETARLVGR